MEGFVTEHGEVLISAMVSVFLMIILIVTVMVMGNMHTVFLTGIMGNGAS